MSDRQVRSAVVTGGAGFIGSTVVDRLLADGWIITAIDAFDAFYPREAKERNIEAARNSPRYRLLEIDTRDCNRMTEAVLESKPSAVIDFAARAGVRPSIEDPATYVDINIRGLQNTLSAAALTGARVVFASSSSVYGSDAPVPFREEQMLNHPESPYAATKIGGEALIYAHHRTTGLPTAVARLFTVYGPRQRPDLAIYRFASRMLRGEPVELYDGGDGVRDYTYVDDVVECFVRLLDAPMGHHLVNVGSHKPIRTSELVDRLEAILGVSAKRVMAAHQPGDVPVTYASIDRASQLFGWAPRTSFDDGLRRFCGWLVTEAGIGLDAPSRRSTRGG